MQQRCCFPDASFIVCDHLLVVKIYFDRRAKRPENQRQETVHFFFFFKSFIIVKSISFFFCDDHICNVSSSSTTHAHRNLVELRCLHLTLWCSSPSFAPNLRSSKHGSFFYNHKPSLKCTFGVRCDKRKKLRCHFLDQKLLCQPLPPGWLVFNTHFGWQHQKENRTS